MKIKTYTLSSRLSAEKTIAQLEDLLAKQGVQYRTQGASIFSISTPIALFGLQRVVYSNRNWVGLNPFTFISGVDMQCQPAKGGLTEIIVQVNRVRTFLWVAFWVLTSAIAASVMPKPEGGRRLFHRSQFCRVVWFGVFRERIS